jgi:DNA-binding Lrp family transcriptional regulator
MRFQGRQLGISAGCNQMSGAYAITDGRLTTGQMAQVAGMTEAEVNQHLEQLKKDKIFLGWRPVLDLSREAAAAAAVRAVIEVKVTPERGGGFNRSRSGSRFDEVESAT